MDSAEDLPKQGFMPNSAPIRGLYFSQIFRMGWRILYIEKKDWLSLYLDNIKIKSEGLEPIIIPLSDIAMIISDNRESVFTGALLEKCAQHNVGIAICDDRHLPGAMVVPLSGHYRSSRVLEEQARWDKPVLGYVWKRIIQAKIQNQARVLEARGVDDKIVQKMYAFEGEIFDFDATNREGLSAKMYFRALFGNTFYRERICPWNAGLDYGYSIFRSAIARALIAKGFNPQLGIFHRGAENAFNLADDMLEPFRPMVDYWVSGHLSEETLFSRKHRLELIRLPTKKFLFKQKWITALNAMELVVEGFSLFMETGDAHAIAFPESIPYEE